MVVAPAITCVTVFFRRQAASLFQGDATFPCPCHSIQFLRKQAVGPWYAFLLARELRSWVKQQRFFLAALALYAGLFLLCRGWILSPAGGAGNGYFDSSVQLLQLPPAGIAHQEPPGGSAQPLMPVPKEIPFRVNPSVPMQSAKIPDQMASIKIPSPVMPRPAFRPSWSGIQALSGGKGIGGGYGAGRGQGLGSGSGNGSLGIGDVSFRMYWSPPQDDIDLHVKDPHGHQLWYGMRHCICGGQLDRDDRTSGGPENIFWPTGWGPVGRYIYSAHYYAGTGPKTVTIEVRKEDKILRTQTFVLNGRGDFSEVYVYEHKMDTTQPGWLRRDKTSRPSTQSPREGQ